MSDSISRQAAIDALAKFIPYAICDESTESYTNGLTDAYNLICQLPSAQPERKKGKWMKATGMMPPEFHGHHCCSECGNFANMEPPFGNRESLSKFCPNCGCRMKGADDE